MHQLLVAVNKSREQGGGIYQTQLFQSIYFHRIIIIHLVVTQL